MNIDATAKYLFVSRSHVRRLVERGAITGTPIENEDYIIDKASVEKYAAEKKRAARSGSTRRLKITTHRAYEGAHAVGIPMPSWATTTEAAPIKIGRRCMPIFLPET
jgi:excisionase family DNA binding protein